MRRSILGTAALALLIAAQARAGTYSVTPVLDFGNSDGASDEWSYVCEQGAYQAWFKFDVSVVPDGEEIVGMSLRAMLQDAGEPATQRTLWYDPDDSWTADPGNKALTEMVGSVMSASVTEYQWETIAIDLTTHDWQADLADNLITLMLTGPANGDHECGYVLLTESGTPPVLEVATRVIPEPSALASGLIGAGLCAGLALRRRR